MLERSIHYWVRDSVVSELDLVVFNNIKIAAREKELAAQQAALKAERERQRVAAETEYQRAAEERRRANAPDREKLLTLATQIEAIQMPTVEDEECQNLLRSAKARMDEAVKILRMARNVTQQQTKGSIL